MAVDWIADDGGRLTPNDERQAARANVFAFAQIAAGTLYPLFPYLDAGSMVPAVALIRGDRSGTYDTFIHRNTNDEVVVIFGGIGAPGRSAVGVIRVGNKTHPVGNILTDETDEDEFVVISITQRQFDAGPQQESVSFQCVNCRKEIARLDFDATPPAHTGPELLLPFETLLRSAELARRYNDDADQRRCCHCGHDNPPFPADRWGWPAYASQSRAVGRARSTLEATAAALLTETAGHGD